MLAHVDDISGAKRQENLREHADDARVSKQLATMQRDVDVEVDLVADRSRAEPDRSRLREVFRDFELRDPLRRLEEALGSADAAAPRARGRDAPDRARARGHADASRDLAGEAEVALAVARAGGARGRAVRPRRCRGASAPTPAAPRCSPARRADPGGLVAEARATGR